jgi:hypothetical protein
MLSVLISAGFGILLPPDMTDNGVDVP